MGTDQDSGRVTADAALAYEKYFVPALFAQWTAPVLDAAGVRPGDRVLDVGCGTGVLARAAAARVGDPAAVVGVDPNDAMLTVARRVAPHLDWRIGVAEELPVADQAFDRGLSQFALMFCTDRAAAIAELRRVVRPGGTIAIATWADLDATPGYAAMVRLLRRLVGDHAAAALSAPFAIGRPAQLSELMRPTFPDVDVRQVDGLARFPSIESWVRTDIDAWTLREMIDDAQRGRLLAEARTDLAPFAGPGGAVSFPAPALIATATC